MLRLLPCSFLLAFLPVSIFGKNIKFEGQESFYIKKLAQNYNFTLNKKRVNSRTNTKNKQGLFVLKIFLPSRNRYKVYIKVPQKTIKNENLKSFIKIHGIYYVPSMKKKPRIIFSEISPDKPYLYKGNVIYNFRINIMKLGLYYVVIKYKKIEKPTDINLIVAPYGVQIPVIHNLTATYFNALKSINAILKGKRYDSSFSSRQKKKLNYLIKVLKRIKIQVKMLSNEEKAFFRKTIMGHKQTRLYISNVKRLKVPLANENQ